MKYLRRILQRWVDRKTRHILYINVECKRIVDLSKQPGMTIDEFYARVGGKPR